MYGHRLLRELIGLLFIFCGLLMLLSLWSYSPADPSFNQAVTLQSKSAIHNSAGMFGAYLAGSMVDIFGVASFLWVFFFLAMGAGLVSHWMVLKWYRWIGYLLLFACVVTLASICDLEIHSIHGGGLAGESLAAFSYLFFSPTGSLLIWIFIFLVAMELSFSISCLALLAVFLAWTGRKLFASSPQDGNVSNKKNTAPHPKGLLPLMQQFLQKRGKTKSTASPDPAPMLDIMLPEKNSGEETPVAERDAHSSQDTAIQAIPSKETPYDADFTLVLESNTYEQQDKQNSTDEPQASADANVSAAQDYSPQHQQETNPAAAPAKQEPSRQADADGPKATPSPKPMETTNRLPVSNALPDEQETQATPSSLAAQSITNVPDTLTDDNTSSAPSNTAIIPASSEQRHKEKQVEEDPAQAALARVIGETMALQESLAGDAPQQPAPLKMPAMPRKRQYAMPSTDLLDALPATALLDRPDRDKLTSQGMAVIECLKNFHVEATLAKITPGPVVTMFELRPAPGVKATRITNLANDLAMSLKAKSVRMQAPVPGTDTVGVEVPNAKRQTVYFREIIENESFKNATSLLTVALGKDIGGRPFSADLAKMPHLLVAGATGKGKSVCLNAILLSLLYRARPDEVQLILVDPKRVEFSMYADLPHLVHPVVTEMDITKNALLWAIEEMNRRLSLFSLVKVRNITGYNKRQAALRAEAEHTGTIPVNPQTGEQEDLTNMPFLVIVIDELADLMQLKRKEVEGPIVRLAQLARAAGIHLIVATQRPSVDVVTGLIKANFPCRIAFQVTNGQDSRTILDCVGAEKLLGNGDMLFKPNGDVVQRLHGAFVSDNEVASMVNFWKRQQAPNYKVDFAEYGSEMQSDASGEDSISGQHRSNDLSNDPIYNECVEFVLSSDKVSISYLQRRFRIGFNRAARFVEQMEQDGIIASVPGANFKRVIHDR